MGDWETYHKQTTRFLRESKQEFVNPSDITNAINRARREVAMRAMCVRRLTPISGSVDTVTVTVGGTGYSTSPTVTVSAPDFPSGQGSLANGSQATATATVAAGVIVAITVDYGGAGYFQPIVTITDSTGSGATATATVTGVNVVTQGREQYPLSEIDVSMFPGVSSVYLVHSVAVIYSQYRYMLPQYSFSVYQSKIRQYPASQYQWVPAFSSQTGQGADGTMFFFPVPSQTLQTEYDCFCLPQDLTAPNSQDVIPQPWDDAVPYFAASLIFMELQNLNYSEFYYKKYNEMLIRYSTAARFGRVVNPYGRF